MQCTARSWVTKQEVLGYRFQNFPINLCRKLDTWTSYAGVLTPALDLTGPLMTDKTYRMKIPTMTHIRHIHTQEQVRFQSWFKSHHHMLDV